MANDWKAREWRSGTQVIGWTDLSTSSYEDMRTGWVGDSYNHVIEIKFTPSKTYSQIGLHVNGYWSPTYHPSSQDDTIFRYKILTSENSEYTNPTSSSAYDGTIALSYGSGYNSSNVTFTLPSGNFVSGTTYYIYIFAKDFYSTSNTNNYMWGAYSSTYYTAEWPDGMLEVKGAARIYNGSNFNDMYYPFIYNGSGWDQYIPYIYNGSAWELYGG